MKYRPAERDMRRGLGYEKLVRSITIFSVFFTLGRVNFFLLTCEKISLPSLSYLQIKRARQWRLKEEDFSAGHGDQKRVLKA